jgi:hypothetical protein
LDWFAQCVDKRVSKARDGDENVKPCQNGYPCVYGRAVETDKLFCSLPFCVKHHIEDEIVDKMTRDITPFVSIELLKKEEIKKEMTDYTKRELARQMAEANTYERRRGHIKSKRVATL